MSMHQGAAIHEVPLHLELAAAAKPQPPVTGCYEEKARGETYSPETSFFGTDINKMSRIFNVLYVLLSSTEAFFSGKLSCTAIKDPGLQASELPRLLRYLQVLTRVLPLTLLRYYHSDSVPG